MNEAHPGHFWLVPKFLQVDCSSSIVVQFRRHGGQDESNSSSFLSTLERRAGLAIQLS